MHRRFYLENEQKQRFNLQDLKYGALLCSPAGLGLAMSRSYELTGNVARVVNEVYPLRSFTGVVVFDATRAYDGYRALIDFISASDVIRLVYAPRYESANREFLADAEVESVSKTEIDGGRMECDITITLKSAWYRREGLRLVAEKPGTELRYPRMYEYTYSDFSIDAIEIFNDGHFDAPVLLEAEGELVNPKLSLYVNGALRSQMVVMAVIETGETLVFCTRDDNLMLARRHADGHVENLIGHISIEDSEFFKLPRGLSMLRLSADNEIDSKATLTLFPSYKAV